MIKKCTLLLFGTILLVTGTAAQPTKHALIFAIGKYPPNSDWAPLQSSTDAKFIRSALMNINGGFEEKNITIIADSNADHKGIVNALKNLINKVDTDDIVVIHFSSHGQQLEDDNGDEIADGLDESIVSYDAVYDKDPANYKKVQAGYFRDDEFGIYMDLLRKKLGKNGDILVIVDACHSGSINKGNGTFRGGKPALVSENFDSKKHPKEDTSGVFRERSNKKVNEEDWATYVVISASRAYELVREVDDKNIGVIGPLSNAIRKVFATMDPSITYRTLFAKVEDAMNEINSFNQQHPVIEGNGQDRQLFGGRFIAHKPYIKITSIAGKEITVEAGLFAGLDAGAKLAIYPRGTDDTLNKKVLASGIVSNASTYSATVILDKDPGIKKPGDAWAFVTEPVYKTAPISVGIVPAIPGAANSGFSDTEIEAIKTNLKKLPLIVFEGKPEVLIVKGPGRDSIIIASNDYLFATIKHADFDSLKIKMQRYAQYKLLQGFVVKDPKPYLDIKLVPVINGKADKTRIESKIFLGVYEYEVGDTLVLWIKNTGKEAVFFNVLDLQPDGVINAVLPRSKAMITPEELRIEGGDSILLKKYQIRIGAPCGNEIFKIFVSKEPINMEVIVNYKGGAKGSFKPLESLVNDSYNIASKDATSTNISNADGSVYNLLFTIKEKKKK